MVARKAEAKRTSSRKTYEKKGVTYIKQKGIDDRPIDTGPKDEKSQRTIKKWKEAHPERAKNIAARQEVKAKGRANVKAREAAKPAASSSKAAAAPKTSASTGQSRESLPKGQHGTPTMNEMFPKKRGSASTARKA